MSDLSSPHREEEPEEELLGLADAAECFCNFLEDNRDYAIILLDMQGRINAWNAGAEYITGLHASDLRGAHFSLLYNAEDREADVPGAELRAARTSGRSEDERWHIRKDGSLYWASGILVAVRGKDGRIRAFSKIFRDLTERHRWEEERRAAAEKDRRIAEALQRAMLVPVEEDAFSGVSIATLHEAALEEAEVGGDFYDAFPITEEVIALAVGDASGKGLDAAARTTQVKDVLRAFLRSFEDADAANAMERLNDYLCDNKRTDLIDNDGFVCLHLVILNTTTGEATFCVAGAEPPLVLRSGGDVEIVEVHGLPLGIVPHTTYPVYSVQLHGGDAILLATDGITEARRGREFLTFEGMVELACASRGAEHVADIARTVLEGAKTFAGGTLHDDACLLVARRR